MKYQLAKGVVGADGGEDVARKVESNARTVEEAVKVALVKLSATLDQVDIKILDAGSPGKVLGLGSREARVSVSLREQPYDHDDREVEVYEDASSASSESLENVPVANSKGDVEASNEGSERGRNADVEDGEDLVPEEEIVRIATELIEGIVERMGFEAEASVEYVEGENPTFNVVSTDPEELRPLIGRGGETLRSFGFLLNTMISRAAQRSVRVTLDVNGHRSEREKEIRRLAEGAANDVRSSQEPSSMEPMSPYERRLVHVALAEDPDVDTYSIGEGRDRHVVVGPKV